MEHVPVYMRFQKVGCDARLEQLDFYEEASITLSRKLESLHLVLCLMRTHRNCKNHASSSLTHDRALKGLLHHKLSTEAMFACSIQHRVLFALLHIALGRVGHNQGGKPRQKNKVAKKKKTDKYQAKTWNKPEAACMMGFLSAAPICCISSGMAWFSTLPASWCMYS